jgi:ATP:cob(I)alamin adenosyltransferase
MLALIQKAALIPSIHPLTKTFRSSTSIAMKIYTKTGDKGTSALYSGERRSKDDDTFAALGDIDELNSTLGLARDLAKSSSLPIPDILSQLEEIQSRLLDVGSAVATPIDTTTDESKLSKTAFDPTASAKLEHWIDAMTEQLPPLANFILPSGGPAASGLHLARSTCRRAERSVVPLVKAGKVDGAVGVYLNRLSDYLFTAARMAAMKAGEDEVIYKKA